MTRKSIATNAPVVSCDVCGRTLLRGENADVFLHGGARRTVCELCTARAMHEGWIREGLEGTIPGRAAERGSAARSLLGRLRHRRESRDAELAPAGPPDSSYDAPAPAAPEPVAVEPAPPTAPQAPAAPSAPAAPVLPVMPAELLAPAAAAATESPRREEPRRGRSEPKDRPERNVHAVPTNAELKIARALELFNASPHTRTVAGVTRSLGAPEVTARPSTTEGSIVTIVVAWELSWYRFEVDLGDEAAGVRVAGQGAELSDLEPADRRTNAVADERGALQPGAGVA